MHEHVADVTAHHPDGSTTTLIVRWTGHNPAAVSIDDRNFYYGGSDEFPELRETIRSSRASRRASSAFSARSAAISRSRAAHEAPPAAGGKPGTSHHDQDIPEMIKPTR